MDETPEYLAREARKGNDECFAALSGMLKTKLFRTAKGILGDENLALDAVSEAVFRAYRGIRRLREPKYAETWFVRIVVNIARDISRKRKREAVMVELPEGEGGNAYYDNYGDVELRTVIDALQPELREIISLKYYSGYTLNEIAAILDIPEGTVKSRLSRALNFLRMEVLDE